MAIPGPFDYENGISRMQGLNKYDAIYGIPLEREIKARVPELGSARFLFLHDIEAFALGESWYGNCRDADKILCVCIGTGAGSAFVENGKTVKTGKGVPENGWIYQQPFGDAILDDYLSVRGLEQISLAVTGKVWSGKELYGLVKAGNMEAEEVWRRYGRTDCKKFFLVWKRTGKRVREKKDSDSDRNGNIRPCHGRPVVTVS